jgi:transposase, IS30 family
VCESSELLLSRWGSLNGLLRQYFPKGTDLSVHAVADLDTVAAELDDRPRKRLVFCKPMEES